MIFAAHLERNLRLFAKYYRPLIHGRKKVEMLLHPKDETGQKNVYENNWNTWWWKLLFRIFFNNTTLKMIGPDRDFFNYVTDRNVGKYLLDKTANHFRDPVCQNNPFLHYALKGHFADCLPHAWEKQNFETIRERLGRIKQVCGFAEDTFSDGKAFDVFNLSNIFEYTTNEEFLKLGKALHEGANPGARFFYWNILLPRKLSDELPSYFSNQTDTSIEEGVQDHGWIYYRFLAEVAKKEKV